MEEEGKTYYVERLKKLIYFQGLILYKEKLFSIFLN
jgi:hypothetical protein